VIKNSKVVLININVGSQDRKQAAARW